MEYEQITLFQKPKYKIDKPIRLIELFAGIGSQAKALERLGANFEHYRVCEFDKYAIKSYNAIHKTNFETSDITQLKGADLGIVDTDKFTYLLTYSFPCTDLSLAGKQQGMSRDSGTRSGLLWEVERLLNETENLPQVLLMENVTQVHGKKNLKDFEEWIRFLENKGYSNYWQDLNAKHYGIPQNRNRTFMVSVLGNYDYSFPKPVELKKHLKDVLEFNVDEKFYLSEKGLKYVVARDGGFCQVVDSMTESVPCPLTAEGNKNWTGNFVYDEQNCYFRKDGCIGTVQCNGSSAKHNNVLVEPIAERESIGATLKDYGHKVDNTVDVASTILARDYKGLNTYGQTGVIEIETLK